jgi:hypothetical protein
VLKELLEHKEIRVLKVTMDPRVPQEHKGQQVRQVIQVTLDLQDKVDTLVHKDQREPLVIQEHRVRLGLQDPQVIQVLKDL